MRPMVCRTLGLTADPTPTLNGIALELDRTYRDVAQRLPVNPAVRFETVEMCIRDRPITRPCLKDG